MLRTAAVQFQNYGISAVVLVVFNTPFLKIDRRSIYDDFYLPRAVNINGNFCGIYPKRKTFCHSQSQFPDENVNEKQQHIHSMVICHQSYQLKNCKFYENFSEYANFSKSSGKGHKTKGQIL